jgi:hypothetical protein
MEVMMASGWERVDRQVERALQEDKELAQPDELYYALRSRTLLLYVMFHLRELITIAESIRLYAFIVMLLLVLSVVANFLLFMIR